MPSIHRRASSRSDFIRTYRFLRHIPARGSGKIAGRNPSGRRGDATRRRSFNGKGNSSTCRGMYLEMNGGIDRMLAVTKRTILFRGILYSEREAPGVGRFADILTGETREIGNALPLCFLK